MDSDDAERKLFPALLELFRPYVAAVQMPKFLAWARSPYSKEEKKVLLSFWFTPLVALALVVWKREKTVFHAVAKTVAQVLRAAFNRPRMSEKRIKDMSEQWLTATTTMFVRGWINALLRPSVDLNDLDDLMLPATSGFEPTSIMAAGGDYAYTEAEVNGILRAVKASLPPGQRLPAEAFEIVRISKSREKDLFGS